MDKVQPSGQGETDPLVMYYVIDKGARMHRGEIMHAAGIGAISCISDFSDDPAHREHFRDWRAGLYRKVALRAGAEQLRRIESELDCSRPLDGMLCLPPMPRSAAPECLRELHPHTDSARPQGEPAAAAGPAITYLTGRGLLRSDGKAIAQAGHAASLCMERFDAEGHFDDWRASGRGGEVRIAGRDVWRRVKRELPHVSVVDAGLTQLRPGTETVICIPPLRRRPPWLLELELI